MSEQTIRRSLGKLQEDPDHEAAWTELQDAVTDPAGFGMPVDDLLDLLEAARQEHAARAEYDAVAELLQLEVMLASGSPREADLQAEYARVLNDVLDDATRAMDAIRRLSELRPDDPTLPRKVQAIQEEKARWPDLLRELMEAADRLEAEGKPEAQAGLLYSAAQMAFRYGLGGSSEESLATRHVIIDRLEEALELAPERSAPALLLERLYRIEQRWDDVVRVLDRLSATSPDREVRLASATRLARVARHQAKDEARALSAYRRVLEQSPADEEAIAYIADVGSRDERWDDIVALYESALGAHLAPAKEIEISFQIAMTHWRMRGQPAAAEPYFEKIRRAEPANAAMLGFYREILGARNDRARLAQILGDAQRSLADGPERQSIATELAKIAEETQGAGKAIEHWRHVLRAEPGNVEARDSLKRLYHQTESWPALIDLLRHQLERLPPNDPARLPVLREQLALHRDKTHQDAPLVPILNQIVQLEPDDADAVREQVRVFDSLNRPRDLIAAQSRLAELETEPSVRADLWLTIARQWLDKFSNVQNAIDAYEKLHVLRPDDDEAIAKLRELYTKRRAYRPLFDLLGEIRAKGSVAERRELTVEMAKLAAERLDRGTEAIALYWEILADEPAAPGVLDALEKQAERERDFAALARALDFRIAQTSGEEAKIRLLERLGSLYETRLEDRDLLVATWRRVLELRPGYPKAVRILREEYLAKGDYEELLAIYAPQADWEGFADALSAAADAATEPATKLALSRRVAEVVVTRLPRPERAAPAYERILAIAPDDLPAARALAEILDRESQWSRLGSVLELVVRFTADDDERVRVLERLRELAAGPLADRAGAFEYARRVYALRPTPESHAQLREAARDTRAFEPYVEALRARAETLAASGVEAAERASLRREIAQIMADDLGRVDDGVSVLRDIVREDVADREAVRQLDQLLRASRRSDELRELFALRLERAEATDERVGLLVEWAQLEEDVLGALDRARENYRGALELAPDNREALRALARIELGLGNVTAAVAALEKERDLTDGPDRAAREVDLARLYLRRLQRPVAALDAAVRALRFSPRDVGAIAILEQIEALPDHRAAAAEILEREYEAVGDHDKQARALESVLAGTTGAVARRSLFERLATVHRERRGDPSAAFDVMKRAVDELPDDFELWSSLSAVGSTTGRLREVADAYAGAIEAALSRGASQALVRELSERISALLEDKLSDPEAATPHLVRIVDADPGDPHAFARLKQIYTARERWDDLERLYDRAIAASRSPARRVELLSEVALVFEDILDDPERAVSAHERILETEPLENASVRSLEKLYARLSRWRELGALLLRRLADADAASRPVLELRIARIHLDKLGEPAVALQHASSILEAEIDDVGAREVARAAMDRPATRLAAAHVLDRVYESLDAPRELAEVTAILLAEGDATGDERKALLRRLAKLRDERLGDDEGTLAVLSELVPLDPSDVDERRRLSTVGRRAGAHARVADVLGRASEATTDAELRATLELERADVFESYLNDDLRAEACFRSVLVLAKDIAVTGVTGATSVTREQRSLALKSLERIYEGRGALPELAEVLALDAAQEDDPTPRRALLLRLGTLREELGDLPGAIDAWKGQLELDPADEDALAALDRLYTATGDSPRLVEVLRAREPLTSDPASRRAILRRIAEIVDRDLGDVAGAIEAYRAALLEWGPDRTMLAALSALYERAGAHRDLAEALERQLEMAADPVDRASLLAMVGGIRINKLEELAAGVEAYRDALALDASHAPTRRALERLLDHQGARSDAAALLRPLYEAEGSSENLLRVLEIQVETSADPFERLEVLTTAVGVAEGALQDPRRAFALAARGLELAADMDVVRPWFDRVVRLALATGGHDDLVRLLRRVEPNVVDGEAKLAIVLQIADTARIELRDDDLAREYYLRALDLEGDEPRALVALQGIYEVRGEHAALHDVLRRRAEAEPDPAARVALLYRQALLSEQALDDPRGAIDALEQLIDLESTPPHAALVALERLYGREARWHDVIAVLERQIAADPSVVDERFDTTAPSPRRTSIDLQHAIGVVAHDHLSDVERALDQFRTALSLDPTYAPSIERLEAMLADTATRVRAAEVLEPVYLQRSDWRRVLHTLEVRLADAMDPQERRSLLARIAVIHEEEGGDRAAALATYGRVLAEEPGDEDAWREAERIAAGGSLQSELRAIYERELVKAGSDDVAVARLAFRAAEIAESLGDPEGALALYRRAHEVDPSGKPTFDAIERLLAAKAAASGADPRAVADEQIALYREALDHRFEPTERVDLLRKVAELQRDVRRDDVAAIASYRDLLDSTENDASALDALEALLERNGLHREHADVLERRADLERDPALGASHRLRLARLLDEELGEPGAAVEHYERIVQVTPGHADAVAALEAMLRRDGLEQRVADILRPLYEGSDDWRRLIALNEEQLRAASEPGERSAILREIATLWEERGGDRAKAFEAIRRAWSRDPEDGALRAEADRLAEALGDWDGLAAAYEEAARAVDDISRGELLRGVAAVHDRRRDDPRSAMAAFVRLYELDRDDLAVLDRIDTLATLLGDWATLDVFLAKKAEAQGDPQEQAETWRRLGSLRRDDLDERVGALEAYERALELEPDDPRALDALIALHEERDDARRLVELYQRRVDVSSPSDDALRYDLSMRRARRAEAGGGGPTEVIESLRGALDVRPGDADAVCALERIYEAEKMWPDLLEAIRLRAAVVDEPAERAELRKRVAALHARELEDPASALEVYRQVLEDAPGDEQAIVAVRALGEQHADLRTVVADVLEPVLRGAGRWEDLIAVLEMRLASQLDAYDRAQTFRALASVHEEGRRDAAAAHASLRRAFEENPGDVEIRRELERLSALESAWGQGDGGWRELAGVLEKRAAETYEPELACDLLTMLARIAELHLHDDARAAAALARAAELAGDSPELLEGLDHLYSRLRRWTALADVLERRIQTATEPRDRAELRRRGALLQIEELGAKPEGLAMLRSALEEVPDHVGSREALEGLLDDGALFEEVGDALEPVYRASNDQASLARLYERRVDRAAGAERTRLLLELSRIYEERIGDFGAAQRQIERALRQDPSEPEPLGELERILPISREWASGAETLAEVLRDEKLLSPDLARDMWLKLARWRRDHLDDARGAEDATLGALAHDPDNVEILGVVEQLQRAPGRERELVATLRRRAALESSADERQLSMREAHTLAVGVVADRALAEQILRDLLRDDEANAWALEQLTAARAAARDFKEVFALLVRRAELASSPDDQSSLRHEAARIAKGELDDAPGAIELYRDLLDGSPGGVDDAVAARELRELYTRTSRFDDLADLLGRLLGGASSVEERSRLRIELAIVQQRDLDRPDDAVETLRAVVDEVPGNEDAIERLAALYESLGRFEDLASLISSRVERARDALDQPAVLALQMRLAELYAARLNDPARTIEVYRAVLVGSPRHVGALAALVKLHHARGERAESADALSRLVDESVGVEGAELALRLASARGELDDNEGRERALRRASTLADEAGAGELGATARKELRAHYQTTGAWGELASLLEAESARAERPIDKATLLGEAAEFVRRYEHDSARAASLLELAAAATPEDRSLLLRLSEAYSDNGKTREAADVLRRIIESFGGKRSKELALYHHKLARALGADGERDAALRELDLAFKIDPGNVSILRDLGKLALETGDLERAQKSFRALLLQKLDSSSGISKGEVFYSLGEISHRQGDRTKALQMFERAVESDPNLTQARERVAELRAAGARSTSVFPKPEA